VLFFRDGKRTRLRTEKAEAFKKKRPKPKVHIEGVSEKVTGFDDFKFLLILKGFHLSHCCWSSTLRD
jgi:hypothetical protein